MHMSTATGKALIHIIFFKQVEAVVGDDDSIKGSVQCEITHVSTDAGQLG